MLYNRQSGKIYEKGIHYKINKMKQKIKKSESMAEAYEKGN